VFVFSVAIDAAITRQSGRVSVAIVFSYGSWLLIIFVLLTIVSDQLAGSGLLGLSAIASFLLLRGSAQLYESNIFHWGLPARSESGLAVTSVLILERRHPNLLNLS
jgi:hypothetical protein